MTKTICIQYLLHTQKRKKNRESNSLLRPIIAMIIKNQKYHLRKTSFSYADDLYGSCYRHNDIF